jgi:PAS domain S-box-containing protein
LSAVTIAPALSQPKSMNLEASKISSSLPKITGYDIIELLYLGSRTAVYRAVQTATQRPVVIKLLRSEYPSFAELVQFRHQYTIAKNLPSPGIVQALSLESWGNSYALVMEDWGGVSLEQYLQQQSLDLVNVLAIALQIANILHDLHQHRVIHKDIKPANILIHPESKQIKLIDFSIASLLPKETQDIQSPNILEGTLAYLAPEQTGRMNRGIDYRADFYALGVTLYQLLTGTLPFTSTDPLELVHCHMAKMPLPIAQVKAVIPGMVAAIVAKLMAKNAEDRYQSARGLQQDLEQCLHQWKETGEIGEFELGQRDLSDRFLIPEKLYGREAEVQTLLDAFDRVANGASELMLVAGFSGIGKTAVVNEVHKPITRQQGYFIKGKFDQFNRNIPLSAFVQALRDLMGQLLTESDTQLADWKARILAAVETNGQVLIEVIPELEQIIGKQSPVSELSGSAAQNRFNRLFPKFIEVFTTHKHPLVIFLDDLQWADSASLQLIKLLMNDNGYLLMLGAYRDNEVSAAHPFILTVDDLQKAGTTVNNITLAALDFADANHLMADTLSCPIALAQPLTELVMQKTQGNPFFLTQFLKALHEDGQITFNPQQRYWECDITEVRARSLTDDVVEFMAQQLQKLPTETQEILKLAACVGNQFDLNTVAIVSARSPSEVAVALWKALQEGLIVPTSQVYKFFHDVEQTVPITVNPTYRFLHDRIQQSAYSLIPDAQKQQTHLTIGRLLLNHQSKTDYLFDILSHFNRSITLVDDPQEQRSLAQLNLAGCQRAKLSAAYGAAVTYAGFAIRLLPPDAWTIDYPFTLQLHEAAAETAYLQTDFRQAETLIQTVLRQSRQALDCIKSYELLVQIYIAKDEQLKAIDTGLEALNTLGVELIERTDWQANLPPLPDIENAANLPTMSQPEYLAALQILITITPPIHHVKPELFPAVVLTMVHLCDRAGYSGLAAYVYGIYGLLLCAFIGDLETAHRAGKFALTLLEQYSDREVECKVKMLFAVFVAACKEPAQNTLPLLRQGIDAGLAVGDIGHVSYSIMAYFNHLFLIGQPLSAVKAAQQNYLPILEQFKQEHCIEYSKIWLQLADEFSDPRRLSQAPGLESETLQRLEDAHNHQSLFAFHLAKLISGYLFGQYEVAVDHAVKALESEDAALGVLLTSAHNVYYSLSLLALMSTQTPQSEQTAAFQQVVANQAKLQHLANHAPSNYGHQWQLVAAEMCRVQGHKLDAIELYDHAIASAQENDHIQAEALANELAAKFYLAWGKEKVAAGYLQEAYYGYARWSAKAKTNDLEQRYPQLLRPILQQAALSFSPLETIASIASPHLSIHPSIATSRSSSSTSAHSFLDFASVLKASQSLSSTIQLQDLLQQLTKIILHHSGGDRCTLIRPDSAGAWQVEVIVTPESFDSTVVPLEHHANVPIELIQYVKNTQAPIVIDDLKTDLPVVGSYLRQQQPKSLLGLPLLYQGQLAGIVLLENRLTRGVFDRDRILLLSFLCTQAAISLENARLYAQGQASQRQLTTLISNLPGMAYSCANDETWTMRFISPGCFELTGYTPEEFALNHTIAFADLIHPDDVQLVDDTVQPALAQRRPFQVTYRIHTKQGQEKWVWEQGRGVFDANNQFIAIEGLITDISEQQAALRDREAAEAASTAFQERLTFLIQKTPIGIIEWNTEFKVIGWNPAAEKIFGYSEAEMLNQHAIEIVPESDRIHVAEVMQSLIAQEGGYFSINNNIHKDQTLITCEWINTPLQSAQGEAMGIFSMVQDISDRKAVEAIILQKSQALEQALQDLQNAQLQMVQSEKMSSLGNLVASVAHEINNPIGFLNGSINNAKDYVKDVLEHLALYQQHYPSPATPVQDNAEDIDLEFLCEDLPKLLDSMKGATDRIKGISTSLRTFSRADTEHKISANLHEGIDSTLLILKYRLKANEVRPAIEVVCDYGELPKIDCFPGQLNQVFMNILANAIDMFDEMAQAQSLEQLKAHPQTLTIHTELLNQQVVICIRDNGKGMDAATQAKVFDHLFTTKAVGKGTGLGLAIARQIIVEKHGGEIAVNSALGQGTTFTLRLPI